MKPIMFKGYNIILASAQPEYIPLPALKRNDGKVITCWKLSWKERLKLLFSGTIWITQLTFNQPLQPQRPSLLIYDDMLPEKTDGNS